MAITFGPSKTVGSAYDAYQVRTEPLGFQLESGGFLICRNGGTAWIVAPASSEVIRTWYCRDDAVTTATACTSSSTWFVPTCEQLKNPGYTCNTYWDSCSLGYWSSTDDGSVAWFVYLTNGTARDFSKTSSTYVRAFRCVTY